ncbi:MAG: glucoamylase [Nitrospirales bacterium]|nr:MAG: glucoamylase [Nitrospirales bacterium]
MRRYPPIEQHGVIGDLHTVALVRMNGSIDFMCFPRFDSPTIFASLLDQQHGGEFFIHAVRDNGHEKQLYLTDTNILLTQLYADEGMGEISDFMPIEEAGQIHNVIRRVKTVRGRMQYRMRCAPRFNYASASHSIEQPHAKEAVFISRGPDRTRLRLRASIPIQVNDQDVIAQFTLKAEEHATFILEDAGNSDQSAASNPEDVADVFKNTMNFWHNWLTSCRYEGRWRETIHRSALLLKLLTFRPNGAIVASPTFGLPEIIGGERNWDYRYTWIRDAAFTVYAFLRLGFTQEAVAFNEWVEDRFSHKNGQHLLQAMYRIDGSRDLSEQTLPNLTGYRGSSPVRIGNAAHEQLQIDGLGALMDSVYLSNKYGRLISYDFWKSLARLIDWVCDHWQGPDHGVWEFRGQPREFLYSRLFCWVAIDRGIRLAKKRSLPGPIRRWEQVRNKIYEEVMHDFWNPELKCFVQYKGSQILDASSLMMPLVKFVSPRDPRWLMTLSSIESHLVEDSLVYRFREKNRPLDQHSTENGSFSMCTFWYIECLSRAGDVKKAHFLFDKMLGHANHLGLYGEALGPGMAHLGNFPQALTHLALISAAYDLNRRMD